MAVQTLIKPQEVVTDGIFKPSNLGNNFDQNLIAPFISLAEEGNLVGLLGVDLYEDMIAEQNANISNYNPNAGALVNKFPTNTHYEALWTKYLLRYCGLISVNFALPFIGLQVTNQGVLLKNTEYAENSGLSGIKFLQDQLQKPIDDLEPRIKDFLCTNKANYPLYDADSCEECKDGCNCGYFAKYGSSCPKCIKGRDSSTKVIFY